MKKKKLSKYLWKAILQALEDLEACEKDDRYIINMCTYHNPVKSGKCQVCLAGSIMAQRLKANIKTYYCTSEFGKDGIILKSINFVRLGHIKHSLNVIGKSNNTPEGIIYNTHVTPYSFNPFQFKQDLIKISNTLKKHNL